MGPYVDQLHSIIKNKSLRRGTFTLASGAISNFFFDLKPTMLDAHGATLIAHRVLQIAHTFPDVEAIGGMATGAIPIVAVSVARSYRSERPLRGFFVRNAVKDHGTQQLIDGLDVNGLHVVLVEDVTTTGRSLLNAAIAVRNSGGVVSHAITVVDRLEGGAEHLSRHDITLLALLSRQDFE